MSKDEILFQKIIDYAKANDDIRIVEMNGSRVNPNVEPDQYQDFDIVFYVNNFQFFIENDLLLNNFGNPLLSQTSKDQRDGLEGDSFIYMMQYSDGTRLDLSIVDFKKFSKEDNEDSLSVILIDKEGFDLNRIPDESSYYVKPITKKDFDYCVNEFFWLIPYVAKGIARKHYFYAHKHLEYIRHELEMIIDWWIGQKYDFKISVGKGKHRYKKILSEEFFLRYQKTYTNLEGSEIWTALKSALDLFDDCARELAKKYQYYYDEKLKNNVLDFLNDNYKKKENI